MLFTVPSTGRFYRNLSAFNNPYKKIPETRKFEPFHETHFVERKNEGRKPDENSVYAQKPRLKMPFKDSIPGGGSPGAGLTTEVFFNRQNRF
jgi:hypothetical protein